MFIIKFLLLLGTWVLFSGKLDSVHLTLGVISSLIVTVISHDLILQDKQKNLSYHLRELYRAPLYVVWLIWQIAVANFYVLYLALHPRARDMIDPRLMQFKSTKIDNDFAHFVFANSITLTPGTVTVLLEGNVYTVHAITEKAAEGLPDPMEDKVAWAFNVGKGKA